MDRNSEDPDGAQSYYKVDGKPLGERKSGFRMIAASSDLPNGKFRSWQRYCSNDYNHAYLDNPTFRGMRQSLMKTFDKYMFWIYEIVLKVADGGKDENVFDIRQAFQLLFRKEFKKDQCLHTACLVIK